MKKFALLAILFLVPLVLKGETYSHYFSVARSSTGASIASATVTVYIANTTNIATIFSNNTGSPGGNPFLTDSLGNYDFWANPGMYKIVVTKLGVGTFTVNNVPIGTQIHGTAHSSAGTDPISPASISGEHPDPQKVQVKVNGSVAGAKSSINLISSATTAPSATVNGGSVDVLFNILSGSIVNSMLAADSVSTVKILDGSITNSKISSSAAIVESKLSLNFPTHSSGNDPSTGQKQALAGSFGTPSTSNPYVTKSDPKMTDSRNPTSHASTHATGGSDPVLISASQITDAGSDLTQPLAGAIHHTRHEDGGSDEINVTGLSGTLVDPQKVTLQKNGTAVGTRNIINLTEGGNTSLTVTDDPSHNRTNIQVDSIIPGTSNASDTVKGIVKLSVVPGDPNQPIAVGTNDPRVSAATTSQDGLLSASDKTKLNGVEVGADVTDSVNVAAAGAVMSGATAGGDLTGTYPNPTVAPNSIALGTDTTGNYVAGGTASQGLALTGTEAGTLGLIVCTNGQILKNVSGTSWACAVDDNGAGSVLTSGHLFIGNVSNVATDTAVTGDITVSNSGVTTIGSSKVTSSMITDGTIVSADISSSAAIPESKLSLSFATHDNSNDPTSGQKAALIGTNGTPGSGNKYVTDTDSRNTNTRTPVAPTASTLGGVKSISAITHNFLISLDTTGTFSQARPACADLSDSVSSCSVDTTNASNITTGTLAAGLVATLNQNTTGSAAKWTTARNLAGNSVDGSATVPFANKFIVQGTSDSGLSAAQFLGSLGTGIVKNTITTGVLSIAVAADFPTLNQSTTGNAATSTAFAANGSNCSSGQAAGGVDASGASENCTAYAQIAGDLGNTGASPQVLTTHLSSALPSSQGGSDVTTATDDTVQIGNGTVKQEKTIPNCVDTGGNHLNYTQSTNTLSCGTSGSGGGSNSFTTIATTSGTSPVASTTTDTLNISAGSGISVTGNSGTKTVTIATSAIDASVITTNTVGTARLGSGTADSAKYLRGDQVWSDPLTTYDEWDDFVSSVAAVSYNLSILGDGPPYIDGRLNWTTNTLNILFSSAANHPGIITLTSDGTNNAINSLYAGIDPTVTTYVVPSELSYFAGIVRIPTAVTNRKLRVGLATDFTLSNTGNNGIYLEYDSAASANWRGITKSSSTATTVSSSIAASAATWYKLEIRKSGGTVTFYVNGTSIGTSTTNIPSTALVFGLQEISTSAAVVAVDVDFIRVQTIITR